MRLTILINIHDVHKLNESLNNLTHPIIKDTLDIICFNYTDKNIDEIINRYQEKFYDIKVINQKEENIPFYRKIMESNGDYVLLIDLNDLNSIDNIFYFNYVYENTLENDYEISLFNSKKIEDEKDYKILENLTKNVLCAEDLTTEELYSIYKVNSSILISKKFINRKYHNKTKELISKPLTYLDLLVKSKKLYIHDTPENNKIIETLKKSYANYSNDKLDIINEIESIRNHTQLKIKIDEIIKIDHESFLDNENPEISIVIPLYNPQNKHIQKALNSIFNQTFDFNDLEIVFVNDQSPDKSSLELVEQYTQEYPNIHLYHTPVNGGSGKARNYGIDHANGKYIMFLDQDDYYLSNACELLYNAINKYDMDLVSGNFIRLENNEFKIGWELKEFTNQKKTFCKTIEEKTKVVHFTPSLWTKMISKDFLDQNNLRLPNLPIVDDIVFMHKLLLSNCRELFIDEPIHMYEIRDGSTDEEKSTIKKFSLDNLLTVLNGYLVIDDFYKKYDGKYRYLNLNSVQYLTGHTLINTELTFEEFKIFADESFNYYKSYLEDKNTRKVPQYEKFFKLLTKPDYLSAFKEYLILSSKLKHQ